MILMRPPAQARRRHGFRRSAVLAALSCSTMLAACGDDDPEPGQPTIDATAYATAVEHYAPPANVDEPPKLFLVALAEPITLGDQVAMIEKMGEGYNVTFVDEAEVALDEDAEGKPPLEGGLLIGIGTIAAEPPYTVRVEVYRSMHDITAHLATLAWRAETWSVTSEEVVDSEAFVDEAFVSDE